MWDAFWQSQMDLLTEPSLAIPDWAVARFKHAQAVFHLFHLIITFLKEDGCLSTRIPFSLISKKFWTDDQEALKASKQNDLCIFFLLSPASQYFPMSCGILGTYMAKDCWNPSLDPHFQKVVEEHWVKFSLQGRDAVLMNLSV